MSLINQVLNDLEKRGVDTSSSGDAVRPVPLRARYNLMRASVPVLVVLLVCIGVWKWSLSREEKPMPTVAASAPVNESVSAQASAASSPVEAAPAFHGKPLLKMKSEEDTAAADVKKMARHKSARAADGGGENADGAMNSPLKKISPQQNADSEFNKANLAVQEGRTNDALAGYEKALLIDPYHKAARQSWVGVLLSLKRNEEAERVLQRGLKRDSHDTSFAMLLARIQVERDAVPLALETLQKALPYADDKADYQAFVAALLQRQSMHAEAVARYQIALKLAPGNGVWLMGMGISMQALQRNEEARDAYQRALASKSLNAQLQAFVQRKLKEL